MKNKYINAIKEWFNSDSGKANGVLLGISGGKDSTVALALLTLALDANKVLGVLLPNGLDQDNCDYKDALEICRYYKVNHITIDINKTYNSIITNPDISSLNITPESQFNIAPRLRSLHLYMLGQTLNYRVIGTVNRSELSVGWFTKWADNVSDLNILSELTKSEVVALGRELFIPEKWLVKPPADGIRQGTDEDNLGFTYEELDNYLLYNNKAKNISKITKRIDISSHKNIVNSISKYIHKDHFLLC